MPLLAIFLAWRVGLLLWAAWVSTWVKPVMQTGVMSAFNFPSNLPLWISSWGNMDGVVFTRIAQAGYTPAELPFFPLLPMLMSSLRSITGAPWEILGMMISTVVFPFGLFWAWKLLRQDAPKLPYVWFLLVLLSFPTAYYFTAVYQDALFFTAATGTIWFARSKRWGVATVLAMVGILARLNGLALLVFLAAEYWLEVSPTLEKSWGFNKLWQQLPQAFSWRGWFGRQRYVWLLLAIPAVFAAHLAWIHWRFGDWHLFFDGAAVWHRSSAVFPLQTLWRYAKILVSTVSISLVYAVAVVETLFTALYGVLLLQQWGKLRFSYWIWMVAHFTIPMVTGTLQGMPRYGLHLYPLFLALALWTHRWPKWAQAVYLALGFGLQAWLSMWFLRGYFVS